MVVMLSAPLCSVLSGRLHAAPVMRRATSNSIRRQQAPTSSAVGFTAVVGAAFLKKEPGQHGKDSRIPPVVPSQWLKPGLRGDLKPGELRAYAVAGCEKCVGKTQDGKLFAVGDKVPPTGTSLSVAAKVRGSKIWDGRFGSAFDCFTGEPEGHWCSALSRIGKFIARIIGRREPLQTFEIREMCLSGDVEVMADTRTNSACKSWCLKGWLKAGAHDDGNSNCTVQYPPCGRWCMPDYLSVFH